MVWRKWGLDRSPGGGYTEVVYMSFLGKMIRYNDGNRVEVFLSRDENYGKDVGSNEKEVGRHCFNGGDAGNDDTNSGFCSWSDKSSN